ncbi:MAG: dihydrolipoyl dehydrogenase [Deltaproteobacteria bacterium]|nr:MAG: dihydrolipoyl dehydrogenase [Deltaproteobacteria bacterium]
MATQEVKVPDIGDFKDVPVIQVFVKAGDPVKPEDPLISLESDKATMDVPSPAAGTVKELKIKVGDRVSEGRVILVLETAAAGAAAQPPAATEARPAPATEARPAPATEARPPAAAPAPAAAAAATYRGQVDVEAGMLVIGAGPGGYSAAFRAADLGLKTVLVERYQRLGGVCLNVGCIPSKALLHVARVIDEVEEVGHFGVSFGSGKPGLDLDKLRGWKESVVKKLTGGLSILAKQRKVAVLQGVAQFLDAHHVEVAAGEGKKQVVRFDQCIIAAGSQAAKLPFLPADPRIIDSTGALELPGVPGRMLVIGGGIIGMEMAQVYASLGARITVVELLPQLMTGADPDLVRPLARRMGKRYEGILLDTKVTRAEAAKEGIHVWFEGKNAPKEPQTYERVLVAVGRTPNGKKLAAEKAGVTVTDRGFIPADGQLRTNVPHIFAIGDIVGPPMLAHKAIHEGHVAAEAAAGMKSYFDARAIPSVAFTDPEVAWVGVTEDEAKAKGIKYRKGSFPWAASGRSLALGRDEGMTKLLFDEETHRIIGGGIVGTNAGDLISEVGLAIEMGADAVDIGKTIHPHPTLSESVGLSAEAYEGTITDLYVPKR